MHHALPIRAGALACLCSAILTPLPAGAATVLERFAAAVATVQDYTGTLSAHEVEGSRVQDRSMHVWFKRPSLVKIEVIGGEGKGGAAVWDGGPSVRGHEGGLLRFVTLTLDLHNSRVTSMRGATIENGTFTWQLDHLKTIKGKLSEEPGPVIDGSPTDVIVVDGVDPKTEQGMTKEMYFISRKNSLPTRFEGYDGATLVRRSDYTDVKLNEGLKSSDFNL